MAYVKPQYINLKTDPSFNEKWVQDVIISDPSIIGLGELEVKDSERYQPSGGRLDMLMFDPESNRRYEIELQLGKTDETHIIRTLEYWDYEKRRYPQYDHCAVIIAEDITSRFLNVISLFNGIIPIIAIQMKALKVNDDITLVFSTVLDELSLGTEEQETSIPVDRKYWESKVPKEMIVLCDKMVESIKETVTDISLKYNKYYIGIQINGITKNFISFTPRRNSVILALRLEQTEERDQDLASSDLDILAYDRQWKQYRVRIQKGDFIKNKEVLMKLIKQAYEEYPM